MTGFRSGDKMYLPITRKSSLVSFCSWKHMQVSPLIDIIICIREDAFWFLCFARAAFIVSLVVFNSCI